jgi:peptidoglycan/LPS O-acetylase OafA/YrhL
LDDKDRVAMKPASAPPGIERFVQLDALRFFFALVVVLFHTTRGTIGPVHGGYAVDFFFILSGFVLSHALVGRPMTAGEFTWARVARLYPLHLVTLGWLICLVSKTMTDPPPNYLFDALGLNVVLLQGVWALNVQAWNFPSWSISVEFVVNVLLLYPIVRMRSVLVAAVVAFLSWLVVLLTWGPVFDDFTVQSVRGTHLAGGLLRGAGGILLGYLLYEAYLVLQPRRVTGELATRLATTFECVGMIGLVWCLWSGGTGWDLLPMPLSALLILQMATRPGHVSRLLQGRPFAHLGNISYSIYLIHIPLFATFEGAGFLEAGGPALRLVWFALYLGLLLTLSMASHRYVERPAQRGLMRLFRGWRTSTATS